MIDIDNRAELDVSFSMIKKIATDMSSKEIELLICNKEQMRSINTAQRGIDSATDVLSFPYESSPLAPLGSIVICADYVRSVASDLGHRADDEVAILFIHGVLHLLGFDHESDSGQMHTKELELIRRYNLPLSLIDRAN